MSDSNGNGKPPDEKPESRQARHRKNEWKEPFLAALEESANIALSAKIARVHRSRVYAHRDENEEFEQAWDEALEIGIATLEVELRRRALHGTAKPFFFQGEKCGSMQEYSDVLGMFLLKAHRPDVYRDRSEVNYKHSGEVEFRLGGMTPEQSLDKLDKDLDRLGLRR